MFVYERQVRFEDVDAAGIVFFSHFFNYCHEAMEAMLDPLEGGYANLILNRRLGLPAVRADAEFQAPLRFGDKVRIATVVERIGNSSVSLRYAFTKLKDGSAVATVRHVVVLSRLDGLKSATLPADVRTVFEAHLAPAG